MKINSFICFKLIGSKLRNSWIHLRREKLDSKFTKFGIGCKIVIKFEKGNQNYEIENGW